MLIPKVVVIILLGLMTIPALSDAVKGVQWGIAMAQQTPPPPSTPLVPPPGAMARMQANEQYARAIIDSVNAQMNLQHNSTLANFIHILKQFDLQGRIDCPNPGAAFLGTCILAPKGHG